MQWIVTLSLVSIAALYVAWALISPMIFRKKSGCASGCGGCSTTPAASNAGRLALPLVAGPNKIEA